MAILEIKTYPAEVLKQVAKPVKMTEGKEDPKIAKLCDDMLETMYAAPGIGLAAPQVGQSVRVLVIDTRLRDETGQVDQSEMTDLEKEVTFPLRLINPAITNKDGKTTFEEGCLSVPGFTEIVQRANYVEFEAWTPQGKKIAIKTDGLLAICIQHEIDHLDGKLFIDRLSTVKRSLIKSKIKKYGYPSPDNEKQHIL